MLKQILLHFHYCRSLAHRREKDTEHVLGVLRMEFHFLSVFDNVDFLVQVYPPGYLTITGAPEGVNTTNKFSIDYHMNVIIRFLFNR